jgi:mannose-1-phosphate guanylyltransferase/mannose-6-phosphate isomerase
MKNDNPFVLILCGGQSLRLWPLSEYKSKNFLEICGFFPLELTIRRFIKLTPKEKIFLVANQRDKKYLKKLKLVNKENIFFEPQSKNTAAAILFSLNSLRKYSSGVLVISPTDHIIKKEREFYSALRKSIEVARDGWISTFGILPRQPTPNFGYIQIGKRIYGNVYSVKKFIEKPDMRRAKKIIAEGKSFYNSGMFVSSIGVLDREYKKYYPYYNDFISASGRREVISLYGRIKDIPFDKAIMERSKRLRLVKANFSWRDFGTWQTIYEILPKDKNGNVKKGISRIYKGKNNFIYSDNVKKKILVMGLKDVFFIDTQEYALLASASLLDDLKMVVKKIKGVR